jgi:CBS domain containing-hemolysin-like protein
LGKHRKHAAWRASRSRHEPRPSAAVYDERNAWADWETPAVPVERLSGLARAGRTTAAVDIIWRIVATLGLVALNGYFVAAEFAAVGARASRLETLAEGSLLARLALEVKKKLDLYLSTCQLGITIASLGLGYVTEPAIVTLIQPVLESFGVGVPRAHGIAIAVGLSISTALHVVVGEVAPKNWAIFYPDKLLPILAPPLVAFTYLFYPVIWLLNSASNALLRISGIEISHDVHGGMPHTEDELRALLAQAVAQGTIQKGHERILTSAFGFADLNVRQIMTPRPDVVYLLLQQPLGEILRTVQKNAYTRYPLCDEDIDHVIGIVHMKDLFTHLKLVPGKLRFGDEKTPQGESVFIADGLPGSQVHVIGSGEINLQAIKRDVVFVPSLTSVPKMLRMFQTTQQHMAVVVDEYGTTMGIVTFEDVIEELVGDVADEFDAAAASQQQGFVREGENIRVSGQYPLHELRMKLDLDEDDIPAEGVDTLTGYVTQQLGRWPRPGDTLSIGPYVARVMSVQQKRAKQVLLTRAPDSGNGAPAK